MPSNQISACIPLKAADSHQFELYIKQSDQSDSPVMLLFPALGVKASFYDPLAETLSAAGYHVAWFDHRGLGSSSLRPKRGVDYGYETILNQDYPLVVDAVKKEFPDQALFFMGHSLGAQLSAIYAAKKRLKIQGLIHVAAGTPYYKNWKGRERLRLMLASVIFPVFSIAFGYFPGHLLKFAGKQSKTLMLDWARTVRSGNYQPKGSRQSYEKVMVRTEMPILSFTFPRDFFAPPEAAEHLSLKYGPGSKITHLHLPPEKMPHDKINHFNWVKEAGFLLPSLEKWLNSPNVFPNQKRITSHE